MKKWLTHLTIAGYLACLSWGILSHTLSYRHNAHPAMYFVVWDMFCGWSGYSERTHIIGEGESGRYYELAPGPWGPVKLYGDLDRKNYDSKFQAVHKIAANTLKHTEHEPMTRVFVVQEAWAKKYNLSDDVWNTYYAEEKDPQKYYRVRGVMTESGQFLYGQSSWLSEQYTRSISSNPRLHEDARKGRPFYAFNKPGGENYRGGSTYLPSEGAPVRPSAH